MGKAKKPASIVSDDIPSKSASKRKAPAKASGGSSGGLPIQDIQTILNYMKQQNRPYSVNDIFNNLHASIGKTHVQKILDKLVGEGDIIEKTYGKQSVYVIKQDDTQAPSQEELDQMDSEITESKEALTRLKEEWKSISNKVSSLQNTLTIDEMKSRIQKLKTLNNDLLDKIRDLESGSNNTRKVDPIEKKKVDAAYEQAMKFWKARKKMCMEAVNMITENMGMKPKDFMAENGLEDDPA